MSNKTQLQENNVKLQSLLNTINALPDPIPDDLGNATTDKVLKGYTFSSNNGIKLTGNMVLPIGLYLGNPPTKTVYQYNEPLTIEGMTVILKVWDGTQSIETDVTEDCTFTPEAGTLMTTVGFNQIKATYEYNGLTYTVIQDLEVENTLQNIAITSQPNKTEYRYNEGLDITGLVVTATYANEATADVTSLCTFDPAVGETFDGKGQQVVNVTYTEGTVEKTTQFTVDVKGEATYYGSVETGVSGVYVKGTHVGDYAIFVGGKTAEAFNSELVRSNLSAPYYSKMDHGAATAGSYALFAGNSRDDYSYVPAYSSSLVMTSAPDMPGTPRWNVGAASAGTYAIFTGGHTGASVTTATCAYSSELVVQTINGGNDTTNVGSASVGQYAVFAGGKGTNAPVRTAYAYDSTLVKKSVTSLSKVSHQMAGASVGQYAVFAGGRTTEYGADYSNKVDAYNESLVKTVVSELSTARCVFSGTSAGANVVFAGGLSKDSSNLGKAVDTYDSNLIKTNSGYLPEALNGEFAPAMNAGTAAYSGNYAIFRGDPTKAYVYEG